MKEQALRDQIDELQTRNAQQSATIRELRRRVEIAETPQPPVFVEELDAPRFPKIVAVVFIVGCAALAIYHGVLAW